VYLKGEKEREGERERDGGREKIEDRERRREHYSKTSARETKRALL